MSRVKRSLTVISLFALMVVAIIPAALAVGPDGTFTDDNGSVHEVNIEIIAVPGITLGCNPPANDSFCPDQFVTREQMASFLARMLHSPVSPNDYFDDDAGSIHQAAINSIAAAGITLGCNPPANDLFCPTEHVTRGQMAAFLNRGLNLPPDTTNRFIDDNGSIFEAQIQSLAASGITLGCNPPTNDRFCPDQFVTRGQMASFLARSLQTGVNGVVTVNITAPLNLANIPTTWDGSGYSALVQLTASAVSPTGKPLTVIWSSSVDGLLGTGSDILVELNIPAGGDSSQPFITATTVDSYGAIGTATVQVKLSVPSPG